MHDLYWNTCLKIGLAFCFLEFNASVHAIIKHFVYTSMYNKLLKIVFRSNCSRAVSKSRRMSSNIMHIFIKFDINLIQLGIVPKVIVARTENERTNEIKFHLIKLQLI